MRMIEISALENGAHRNQNYGGVLPEGWVVVPEALEPLENFPFGEVVVERVAVEGTQASNVPPEFADVRQSATREVVFMVGWIPGVIPEPEPEPDPGPSEADDTAGMLVDHEYRLTLLELGLTEF